MHTSPVPSHMGDILFEPAGPGTLPRVTLKPVDVFTKPDLDRDVNFHSPVHASLDKFRRAIMEALPDFFEGPDLDQADDILTRHFDTSFGGDHEDALTDKEKRYVVKVLADLSRAVPEAARIQADMGHRLAFQSLMCVAYCVQAVETKEGPLALVRDGRRLSGASMNDVQLALGETAWMQLQLKAFSLVYLSGDRAKNSDGPSKSVPSPRASRSTSKQSSARKGSKSTAGSTSTKTRGTSSRTTNAS